MSSEPSSTINFAAIAASWEDTDTSTHLAALDEDSVIGAIRKLAPSGANGNDAAAINLANGVVGTDMAVEGRHFLRHYSTPRQVGAKVVVQNLADIVAMGGTPTAITMALGAPGTTPLRVIEDLTRGVTDSLAPAKAELIGGDLTKSQQLVLSVTAMGHLHGAPLGFNANSARATPLAKGHIIMSGVLGHSGLGLALLTALSHKAQDKSVDFPSYCQQFIDDHRVPRLDTTVGASAAHGGVLALTDCSDGFIRDAGTLAKHSHLTIDLTNPWVNDAVKEDFSAACAFAGVTPEDMILSGGEDHCLLGIIDEHTPVPPGFRIIGNVWSSDQPRILYNGKETTAHRYWESFRS
ncbi:MAG: AIR synthase related protein [Corynebacterium sp.]|nr:AIR synthase related protein [Corynebacterium sp.]